MRNLILSIFLSIIVGSVFFISCKKQSCDCETKTDTIKKVTIDTLKSTLNDGLLAYYPFNGNAKDSSGNGNNGTIYGATLTTDRFGKINSAYNFNGINNYISVNATNFLNNNYTFALWFKSNATIPIGNNEVLINIGGAAGTQMVCVSNQYFISTNTGTCGSGYFAYNQNKSIYNKISPQLNQWNFVAFSWSNNQIKLVVNDSIYTLTNNGSLPYYTSSPILYLQGHRYLT